jgi:hypothetical protein
MQRPGGGNRVLTSHLLEQAGIGHGKRKRVIATDEVQRGNRPGWKEDLLRHPYGPESRGKVLNLVALAAYCDILTDRAREARSRATGFNSWNDPAMARVAPLPDMRLLDRVRSCP